MSIEATVELVQARCWSFMELGALDLWLLIYLSPFQTDAESLTENWCWSFSEYSRFASLNLSLSPLLKASSLSNLNHNMLLSRPHLFLGMSIHCSTWPTCSPDLSPEANVCRNLKGKMQKLPFNVARFKVSLMAKMLHLLVSSMPECLFSVGRRNVNLVKW